MLIYQEPVGESHFSHRLLEGLTKPPTIHKVQIALSSYCFNMLKMSAILMTNNDVTAESIFPAVFIEVFLY